jgi:diacylglycerol kinase
MRQKSGARAFRHAIDGIVHSLISQRNMKIHLVAAFAAVAGAIYYRLSAAEWMLLTLTIAGVIAAEMLNTAVEAVVDLVSPQVHHLAKTAKDVAAGAVLIMAAASLVVGYLLFFHRLFG